MSRRISGVRPRTRPLIETRAPDGVDRISSFPGGTLSRLPRVRSLAGGVAGSAGTAACGRAAGAWRRGRCLRRRLRLHLRLVDASRRRRLLHRLRRQRGMLAKRRAPREPVAEAEPSRQPDDERHEHARERPARDGIRRIAAPGRALQHSRARRARRFRLDWRDDGTRTSRDAVGPGGGRDPGNRQRQVRRVVRVRRRNSRQRRVGKDDVHGPAPLRRRSRPRRRCRGRAATAPRLPARSCVAARARRGGRARARAEGRPRGPTPTRSEPRDPRQAHGRGSRRA